MQHDLFDTAPAAVRSFPAHLDPARKIRWESTTERDSDHVAAPVGGTLPIGALGTSPAVRVVRALDATTGELLGAWTFSTAAAADRFLNDTWDQRHRNAQSELF
jgi:hypothetical protein